MLIFDRDRPDHPWARAFDDLSTADDPTHRILAENWRLDPRVSEEREIAMLQAGDCGPSPVASDWLAGRYAHYYRHICRPPEGDGTDPGSETLRPLNQTNRLGSLPGYEQLVHVKNLNGVLWRLGQPGILSDDQKDEFEELTGHPMPDRPPDATGFDDDAHGAGVDAIVADIQNRGVGPIRDLAAFLCQALGSTQPLWWACFAEEVNDLIAAGDGGGLCKALGLGHFREGNWLVVWRYDVRWTRSFYRPTVVEAGASPFHHPSPPGVRYGVTMVLEPALPACREFLHRPVEGRFAAEGCTGDLLRVEGLPEVDDEYLNELRRFHRDRLREEPVETRAEEWLDRHFPDP